MSFFNLTHIGNFLGSDVIKSHQMVLLEKVLLILFKLTYLRPFPSCRNVYDQAWYIAKWYLWRGWGVKDLFCLNEVLPKTDVWILPVGCIYTSNQTQALQIQNQSMEKFACIIKFAGTLERIAKVWHF